MFKHGIVYPLQVQDTLFKTVEQFLTTAKKPLIVIIGTTASGKTGVSVELCKQLAEAAEVVNSDSRQLYKHITIGTAKITPKEAQGVPHHLLNLLELTEETSVGWYKREAMRVIDALQIQKKVPVLVGGSMLYIQSVTDNFLLPAKKESSVRNLLENRLKTEGIEALYNELQTLDPISANNMHEHNKQHIIRALEFFYTHGKTKTEMLQVQNNDCPYDVCIVGLKRERADIVQRIEKRTDILLSNGWIEEVQALLQTGYSKADPGMKSHGYPDIICYLEDPAAYTFKQMKDSINKQTRAYAKRQMTWWKRNQRINWFNADTLEPTKI